MNSLTLPTPLKANNLFKHDKSFFCWCSLKKVLTNFYRGSILAGCLTGLKKSFCVYSCVWMFLKICNLHMPLTSVDGNRPAAYVCVCCWTDWWMYITTLTFLFVFVCYCDYVHVLVYACLCKITVHRLLGTD